MGTGHCEREEEINTHRNKKGVAMNDDIPATRYKVGRVLAEYDLPQLAEELPSRWLGENGDQQSLRSLAHQINRRILEAAMVEAGMTPLEGEVANYYRLLTDTDVSSGDRTQAQRSLERDGVDVETVLNDFVTHQAVHTFLQKYHDVERAVTKKDPRETIERLRGRIQAVTRDAVESSRTEDSMSFEDFLVVANIEVICKVCGERVEASEVLSGATCSCGQTPFSAE